jgi:hypothetical protein
MNKERCTILTNASFHNDLTKQISQSPRDVDVRRHFLCFATLLPDPAITLRQIQQIKLGC